MPNQMHDFNLLPWRQALRPKNQRFFITAMICSLAIGVAIIFIWHLKITQQIALATTTAKDLSQKLAMQQQRNQQLALLESESQRMKGKISYIEHLQQKQGEAIDFLASIAGSLPVAILVDSLQRDGDQILVVGQTNKLTAIADFMQKLAKNPQFASVKLQEIKNIAGEQSSFTIKISLIPIQKNNHVPITTTTGHSAI
jgi:type IV pilus assembly protein PilN